MKDKSRKNDTPGVSEVAKAFVRGAAAGLVIGILFAPDKGSKTRGKIKEKIKDLRDDFGDLLDDYRT